MGRYAEAQAALEETLPIFRRAGHRYREAINLGNLASGRVIRGQFAVSRALGHAPRSAGPVELEELEADRDQPARARPRSSCSPAASTTARAHAGGAGVARERRQPARSRPTPAPGWCTWSWSPATSERRRRRGRQAVAGGAEASSDLDRGYAHLALGLRRSCAAGLGVAEADERFDEAGALFAAVDARALGPRVPGRAVPGSRRRSGRPRRGRRPCSSRCWSTSTARTLRHRPAGHDAPWLRRGAAPSAATPARDACSTGPAPTSAPRPPRSATRTWPRRTSRSRPTGCCSTLRSLARLQLSRSRTAPGRRTARRARSRSSLRGRRSSSTSVPTALERGQLEVVGEGAAAARRPRRRPASARGRRFSLGRSASSKCATTRSVRSGCIAIARPASGVDPAGLVAPALSACACVVVVGLRHGEVLAGEVAGPQHRVGGVAEPAGEVADAGLRAPAASPSPRGDLRGGGGVPAVSLVTTRPWSGEQRDVLQLGGDRRVDARRPGRCRRSRRRRPAVGLAS